MRTWILGLLACGCLIAQDPPENYDESKVEKYTLPELLVLQNGKPVGDAATWLKLRRPEILKLYESQIYGRTPAKSIQTRYEVVSTDPNALDGKAVRKQITLHFSDKVDGPRMDLLVYLPAGARKPVPAFLGLNFTGNHTVSADPGINLGRVWVKGVRKTGDAKARGSAAGRWPIETILARGYAVATANYNDIEPDFPGGLQHGVRALFLRPGQAEPAADEWGAIGAWAWGMSRALDYLETDKDIDASHVALIGHSRIGKAALWAGAQDQRFALVISNDSGEGGAALSRRNFGETVERLNSHFPHWFCANYRQYSNHPERLPVDQHMLLALIAPRPLYVASAEEDLHSDPRGEFLSAVAAGPAWRLFGKTGLGTYQMPAVDHPIGEMVGYHIRTGKHDVTSYDWDQYLNFASRHFKTRSLSLHETVDKLR